MIERTDAHGVWRSNDGVAWWLFQPSSKWDLLAATRAVADAERESVGVQDDTARIVELEAALDTVTLALLEVLA